MISAKDLIRAALGTEPRPRWVDPPSRFGQLVKAMVLTIIVVLILFPFMSVVSTSLASEQDIIEGGGYVLIPRHPTLDAYRTVLSGGVVTRAVLVSVGVTIVGTLLSLATTVSLAYALSKPGVVARKPVFLMVLFTLLFGPGMIPTYLMVKSLGLLDTYWALILPGLMGGFSLIVLRAFFMNIPQELLDSARIDGAGDLAILRVIVLPLSKAVIAVIGLFYAVGYWNSFFNAVLYLNDSDKWPIQVVLRTYVLQNTTFPTEQLGLEHVPPLESIQMAVVVIALAPIVMVYPFLQKYFTKGVLTGAIKG